MCFFKIALLLLLTVQLVSKYLLDNLNVCLLFPVRVENLLFNAVKNSYFEHLLFQANCVEFPFPNGY